MDELVFEVGQKIRSLRVYKGLTQEQLAEKATLHSTYIGQVERGEKNVTLVSLAKILDALDISFSEFFKHFGERTVGENIAFQCYNIVNEMDEAQQKKVFKILSEIEQIIKEK